MITEDQARVVLALAESCLSALLGSVKEPDLQPDAYRRHMQASLQNSMHGWEINSNMRRLLHPA